MKIVTLLAAVFFLFPASPSVAQTSGRNAAHEKRIEDQLASIAPQAVPTFQAATRALDAGDLARASELYGQVLAEAPLFSPALRRRGGALVAAGEQEQGFRLLTQAVTQERTPDNLFSLAAALAYPTANKVGSFGDLQRALELAKEAAAHPAANEDASYLALLASLAAALQRAPELRDAVRALKARYPNEMLTHSHAAILAAYDGEWVEAEREIRQAEQLGLPHDAAAAFLASGVGTRARVWRAVRTTLYALMAWAIGLIVLFLAGRGLSTATLRSVDTSDPNDVASASELRLRRVYRGLIRTAGIYYYVSLPFVVILVIGSTAAVFYGFMLIGRIPIQLAAALAIGALITIYKMVQSLFARVESEDPGRSLEPAEAPGLWTLTRAVAEEVGTRTIDEIRVTPGTELAVYEQGTRRERAQDQARRTLILGVGVLTGFRPGAFRAVLAHEYGHFAHRDTAGGDVALRVRQDMMKFALAMAQHGQAVWWNLAFQFLRVYDFLFRRISHGATRLQEIMADRVAAQKYGAVLFEEGLRHVIRCTIEFNVAATEEVQSALSSNRPCRNLYALESPRATDVDHLVEEALARPTTEDDTHPGPLERFRLLARVASIGQCAETAFVWDLFADRDAITREMTAAIESRVRGTATA